MTDGESNSIWLMIAMKQPIARELERPVARELEGASRDDSEKFELDSKNDDPERKDQ